MKPFEHKFTIGEQNYTLSYTFAARRAFEREHKMSVPALVSRLANVETQTADALISVFLLLLSTHHPQLTADDVSSLVDQMGGDDQAIDLLRQVLEDDEKK